MNHCSKLNGGFILNWLLNFTFLSSLIGTLIHPTTSGFYAVAIGKEDQERLEIVHEIYFPYLRSFIDHQLIRKGDHVLDLGCGIGLTSQHFAKLVGSKGSVLGLDLNKEQLAVAKQITPKKGYRNLRFKQGSAFALDKLKEKFDVVYVQFLLMHLDDPIAVIQQIKKVLKPGGRLIIEEVTGNETMSCIPFHTGMAIAQRFDTLQFEIQQSDDHIFEKLPAILNTEGFEVVAQQTAHPKLETARERKMLSDNLIGLKESLIREGKITEAEYDVLFPVVKELESQTDITVYSYEYGQLCAILK